MRPRPQRAARAWPLACLLLLAGLAAAPAAPVAGLEAYRGKNRVLVIRVERLDQVALARQKHILRSDAAGVAQRDLVAFAATRDAVLAIVGKAPPRPPALPPGNVTGRGFEAVLVGRDGRIDARWDRPVSLDVLFSSIDSGR